MAHMGQVVGAVTAVEIAFQAERQRRSQSPALAAGLGAYEMGCRSTQDLVLEAVQLAAADPMGEHLLTSAGRHLFDLDYYLEQDVALLMQSGWRLFVTAAAPPGHQDPTSCVMARRLWLALTRIIVIWGIGGVRSSRRRGWVHWTRFYRSSLHKKVREKKKKKNGRRRRCIQGLAKV
jgi:hypothetical protein